MKALVTGITGQDGSYLAELLLEKGYEVHGIIRRSSSFNTGRIDPFFDKLQLHYGDLTDTSIARVIQETRPQEVYNLAAQSHVLTSVKIPEYTANATGLGTLRVIDASYSVGAKFYQASSSEQFGSAPPPQNEETLMHPRSPYGIAKLYSYWTTINYRESYNMFATNGILFNHESPRRGDTFVTKKIAKALARISVGLQRELVLGNLEARRDWGYAREYVEAMWRMMQLDKADDFVIATGESHTVREFLDEASKYVGLNWEPFVKIDPKYYRPAEVDHLRGDARKAQRVFGWKPQVGFEELVQIMMNAELEKV